MRGICMSKTDVINGRFTDEVVRDVTRWMWNCLVEAYQPEGMIRVEYQPTDVEYPLEPIRHTFHCEAECTNQDVSPYFREGDDVVFISFEYGQFVVYHQDELVKHLHDVSVTLDPM